MGVRDKKYIPLILSLYVNYIFQGIGAIIIAQNLNVFTERWSATTSQVTLVISALGVGRIISLNYAGYFSDKYGRQKAIYVGVISYLIYFLGLLIAPNYIVGFILTLFAGIGNSFLDTGTYPAVSDGYPEDNDSSSLSVLNKAFISTGQFILPLITHYILEHNYYFGWMFIVSAVCLMVNTTLVAKMKFPPMRKIAKKDNGVSESNILIPKSKIHIEGISLLIFSFISVSLFNIFIIWVPTFAAQTIHFGKTQSLMFVSIYSISSFISVFITSMLVKRGINIPLFIAFCTLVTGLAIGCAVVSPSLTTIVIMSLVVGFFSAGGIWQLGVSLLLEFFPTHKGKFTGFYSFSTAISLMLTPYFTGLIAEKSINAVFLYNMFLGVLGTVLLTIVAVRYKKIIKPLKN